MANFTFVTHKGARPEKSELVKSHVMRESQRRRREAKQRRHQNASSVIQCPATASIHDTDEQRTPISIQPEASSPYHSVPISSAPSELATVFSQPATTFKSSLRTSWASLSNFSETPDPGSSLANDTHGPWAGPQDVILANVEISTSQGWQPSAASLADLEINLYSAFGHNNDIVNFFPDGTTRSFDPASILTNQPSLLYPAFEAENNPSEATWMSQRLFDRVTELTSHYTSILYTERRCQRVENPVNFWVRTSFVNSKVLLACALFYCAYRDTMRGTTGTDHHFFKDRLLHLINLALEDPDTAVCDTNIAAVIGMCMYENVRGTDLIVTHLKGLRQMIDMRGGINNLPADQGQHLNELAVLQDMIHSTCSNVPPVMFDICGPILRDVRMNNPERSYAQSPLRVLNDAGFIRLIPELQSSFEVLKDAFDGFEMLCIEAFDTDTAAEEAASFKLHRDKFWSRLTRNSEPTLSDAIPETTREKVEEAILLAAKIHFRATTHRLQHDDEINIGDMKRLHTVIKRIELGFWKVAHYVYLWILLTGGAAASNHTDYRPYFASEIMRLGLSIGLFDWRSFRQTLGNFLWLQQSLRKDKPVSWTPYAAEEV